MTANKPRVTDLSGFGLVGNSKAVETSSQMNIHVEDIKDDTDECCQPKRPFSPT